MEPSAEEPHIQIRQEHFIRRWGQWAHTGWAHTEQRAEWGVGGAGGGVRKDDGAYLPSLHLLCGHDNDPRVLLEHHPPEIIHRVLQAALSGNVTLFGLRIVALGFKFRLEIRKKSLKHLKDGVTGTKTHTSDI